MTKFEALVSLNMVLDIGSIRLKRLLEYFGTAQNILKASPEELTSVFGIGGKIAQNIKSLKPETLEKELQSARKLGLKILVQDDEEYPENLKNIIDPPIVLYVKGELRKQDACAIGIVGPRRASFYGLNIAEQFSKQLAEKGFTIVSGMALGVDTYAHRGALKAGGRTIAVVGSGFNNLYPPQNIKLAEEISQNGAVVSEFPINTEPFPFNFPRRNRVISGLSLGVLVAEAARNSGALITADFALEQGREVFAVPGKVDSDTSFGPNELIKQGAKLVSCVDDIIEEFNFDAGIRKSNAGLGRLDDTGPRLSAREPRDGALTEEELNLYNVISRESCGMDDLVEITNMDIPEISGILFKLQLKKLIRQLPGKHFVRN